MIVNLENKRKPHPFRPPFYSSQKIALPREAAHWTKVVLLEDRHFIMINFDNLAWPPCVSQPCRWVGICQEWEYVWVRLLYSSQIGFSTSRIFKISETLWQYRGAMLFIGILLEKSFLPTFVTHGLFFFLNCYYFLNVFPCAYFRNDSLIHPNLSEICRSQT